MLARRVVELDTVQLPLQNDLTPSHWGESLLISAGGSGAGECGVVFAGVTM